MKQTLQSDGRPLLTIAIPTYNRAEYLRDSLSNLIDQLAVQPNVELLVSDNASSDETPTVIEEFKKCGLKLRYIRNVINIGSEANCLRCFEQASGKYLWLLGDDDIVLPGSLGKVMNILSDNEYDLIHVGYFSFVNRLEWERFQSKPIEAEIIENVDEMVSRANHSLSFISGNIINRDRVIANIERPLDELLDTCLVQLGWIYTALNHYQRGVYIPSSLVAARDSFASFFTPVVIFGPNLVSVTDHWLKSYRLRRIIYVSMARSKSKCNI